jgi:predicted RNA-binding protein with PIN domain
MLVIDGHNLIGQIEDLSLSDPHDEEKLISRLEEYHRERGTPIIVVFDPGPAPPPAKRLRGKGIKVLFAPPGSKADTLLINLIKKSPYPKGLTIVSSDREVRRAARARRAKTMTAQRFARLLSCPKRLPRAKPTIKERRLSSSEVKEWMAIFEKKGQG